MNKPEQERMSKSEQNPPLPALAGSELPRTEMRYRICGCFSSAQTCWTCASNPLLPEVVALRKALQPFASEFTRRMMKSGMNSTARRDWNERMPDEFPITLKVTMGDCRQAKRILSNDPGQARRE